MRKIHIQMAGLRNLEDAKMCEQLGVDIIGLLVGQKHCSDDFLTVEEAKYIRQNLSESTKTTLITHVENGNEVIEIARQLDVDYIQLHSNIAECEVEKVRRALPDVKIFRLVHILSDGKVLTDLNKIKIVDFYFTDSINQKTDQVGGTGLVHNMQTDRKLSKTLDKPLILAGGLNAENVFDSIMLVEPWAVDVNSGCRAKNGRRSKSEVKKFVSEVRRAEELLNKKAKI